MGTLVDRLVELPTRRGALPPKREDRLAVIESVAAGPAKRKITRAREADSERRATAIKAMQPRHASVWTTIAVLLTVAGIVLFLPDPFFDVFRRPVETLTGQASSYYVELYEGGLVALAGVMLAAGVAIHWWLEVHRPRALPYSYGIYIPYLLFGIPAAAGLVARWIGFDMPGPLATLGVWLAVGATAALAVLLVFSWRSPSAIRAVWYDSEQARNLDRQFRTEVRHAIYDNEHVHLDAYRAQALEGIRLLYAHGLTDAESALWMLQEISPQSAPAAG